MSVLHAPRKPEVDRRLIWFPIIIIPMFFVLFLRLWFIQVVKAPTLVEEAEQNRKVSIQKLAPRGAIFDRRGKMLAGVKPEYVVLVLPGAVKNDKKLVSKLAAILQMPEEEITKRVKDGAWRNQPAPIKEGISVETATLIAESSDLPGVTIDEKSMRIYKDTAHYTHVMGYVGALTDKDEKRLAALDIVPAEYVGRSGIERAYEKQLMGSPGRDTTEKKGGVSIANRELSVPGKQLFLTIDDDLQAYAQAVLSNRRWKGAIVAIDPRNGEILAMVSNPTYDMSMYEGGRISSENYAKLMDPAAGKPMINRVLEGAYPPGSTYKIVTAIAAYRAGKLNRNTTAFCNGGFSFGRGRPLKCMGTHGGIGFFGAMSQSCNTFFCTMGTRAGRKEMIQTSLDCGMGNPTEVELIGERRGIVPTDAWLKGHPDMSWNIGQLANMSIGQGYMNTTPIQLANMMAMVANNGVRYKPHLVRKLRDLGTGNDEEITPVIANTIKADPAFWRMLQDGLVGVVDHGTARKSASIPGLQWGGKTGSAEHGRKNANNTHALFVGFAPRVNPRIAICAVAESAGHGGDAAAPLAAEVVRHYLMRPDAAASNRVASLSR